MTAPFQHVCVPIIEHARRQPNIVAIASTFGGVTYGELAHAALAVAWQLVEAGSDSRYAVVACEHKADAVIGILGAMMAGLCAVPLHVGMSLDAVAPQVLDDGFCLIGTAARRPSYPAHSPRHELHVVLPSLGQASAALPAMPALPPPLAPAYVLMTSGSTGRPKAVVQTHAGLAGNIGMYLASVTLDKSDIVSFVPAYSVDAGLMDMFAALVAGATLTVWETAQHGTEGLYEWVAEQRVTVLHSTPSVLELACRSRYGVEMAEHVRMVVFGGETLEAWTLAAIQKHFPARTVYINGFGPSECTVALQHRVASGSRGNGSCPIGRELPGVMAMVLSETGQDVIPVRTTVGELVIFSPYLAIGYLGDAKQTQARFRDFGVHGRGYLTGDLVRRRDDGVLLFCGRSGHSTKIAGIFVDRDEINKQLTNHPGLLWSCVTIAPSSAAEAGVLAIAFVRRADNSTSAAEIRTFVRTRFPGLPLVVRTLEFADVPLTASGKVDHGRIESCLSDLHDEVAASLPSLNDLSVDHGAALRRFWIGALGVEPHPESNFYADGGTSLMLMRLLTHLRFCLGIGPASGSMIAKPVFADIERLCRSTAAFDLSKAAEITCRGENPYVQAMRNHVRLAEPSLSHIQVACHDLPASIDEAWLTEALQVSLGRSIDWRAVDSRAGRLRCASLPWQDGALVRIYVGRAASSQEALEQLQRLVAPLDALCAFLVTSPSYEEPARLYVGASHIHLDGAGFHALMSAIARVEAGVVEASPSANPDILLPALAGLQSDLDASARQWSRLAGTYEAPLVPGETSVPAVDGWRDFPSALLSQEIDADALGVAECAQRHGVTLPVLLLASWLHALHRETGQASVCLGIPVDLRGRVAPSAALGNYTNTVPARFLVAADQTVASFLSSVQSGLAEALARAELPYPQILRILKESGAGPMYRHRILFTHRRDVNYVHVRDAFGARVPTHVGYSSCELSISAIERLGRITVDIEYASDMLPRAAAEALQQGARRSLYGFMASHGDALLSCLTTNEAPALLMSLLVGPRVDSAPTPGLTAAITSVAQARPDACAIVELGHRYSYAELMERVRKVGRDLAGALGATAHGVVFIRQAAGISYVATCLACEARGLTFVPIDEPLAARLGPDWTARYGGLAIVESDGTVRLLRSASEQIPRVRALYGMFTSGSTGLPKLALNTSKGLLNRFDWMRRHFALARPVTLQTTGHVYDSSLWQLLWPLTQGGTAVIPARNQGLIDRDLLLTAIESEGVNLVDFVPSVLATYLHSAASIDAFKQRARSLEHIIIGGEAFSVQQGLRLQEAVPHAALWNLYGPTEAAIGSVFHRFSIDSKTPLPLGVPIQNTGVCVLDAGGGVLPRGRRGEIVLLGDCVGAGYLADLEATRAKFRTIEIDGRPTRVCMTGDIGSIDADGVLHYHGRLGRTVKVRGQWLDLVALELSIQACGAADRVHAFMVPGTDPTTPAVVVAIESTARPQQLRDQLLRHLPDMAKFIDKVCTLEHFPLSPSGKIDARSIEVECRSGLAAVVDRSAGTRAQLRELRARIRRCWCSTLGTEQVLMDRAFFDQGGNSLLLLKLVDLLRADVDASITPLDVFRNPTIDALELLVRRRC